MEPKQRQRRSRTGCWTCRKRRKKCDSTSFPCGNCQRLGLDCNTETKLVWEDDARRDGMKRRGPTKSRNEARHTQVEVVETHPQENCQNRVISRHRSPSTPNFSCQSGQERGLQRLGNISEWPFELDPMESHMLDHYIQHFSRTYPSFAGPTNPFLRVFVPLSMQSRVVLDAVLALSCVQSWENGGFALERPMLFFRYKALRGSRELIERVIAKSGIEQELRSTSGPEEAIQIVATRAANLDNDDIIHLLATCVLLILYEKLSGESQENGTAHLRFFSRLFPAQLFLAIANQDSLDNSKSPWSEAIAFLSSLFLYNDLVRSTSLRTSTLSDFYLGVTGSEPKLGRFDFPRIVARISAGDLTVTDAEIADWDGRLDWFPSFSLHPPERNEPCERLPVADAAFVLNPYFQQLENFAHPEAWNEHGIVSELYRVAATVYRKQRVLNNCLSLGESPPALDEELDMGNLPSWGVQLLRLLPSVSSYDNTLLWPIAIVAKEVGGEEEREYILTKVKSLEQRFKMKHFGVVREHLSTFWMMRDEGIISTYEQPVLFG
ncbi:hypothetical protein NM208_g6637 [Fusarium decemcellulare]|uniref:Uncharacterized protein n=1 Tax=Fusarium decemcellulare TaxID=57161 RepID=A0ACC1SCA0_9HYPO|nr:hypothetical protein NM208_g6637 [Fusarium decemcellulare]